MTRTFATLYVSRETWDEIYRRLDEADSLDIPCCGTIDMHGIGLKMSKERPREPMKSKRYGAPPPEQPRSEPYRCCWCGEKEEVVHIPPRLCGERFKRGFMGPCEFTPEGVSDLRRARIKGLPESVQGQDSSNFDHEGARRLREMDGRGRE